MSISFTVVPVSIDSEDEAVRRGVAAIAPGPPGLAQFVGDDLPVFQDAASLGSTGLALQLFSASPPGPRLNQARVHRPSSFRVRQPSVFL